MEPFDSYKGKGKKELGRLGGGTCRRGYGLRLQRKTGQTRCAYCGLSLVDCYEHWLLMSVDHVVPVAAGKKKGIREDWLYDMANSVLCCSACNSFRNTWKLSGGEPVPDTFGKFAELRDRVFSRRKGKILERHQEEKGFFGGKPWERKEE